MKKYLSIILILISFIGYSQANIENGYVSEAGEFVFDYETEMAENFTWKLFKEDSTINCFIQSPSNTLLETLEWKVVDVDLTDAVIRFIVISKIGDEYYLDFLNGGKSVIIFNTQTLSYSIMKGDGVYYKQNLN